MTFIAELQEALQQTNESLRINETEFLEERQLRDNNERILEGKVDSLLAENNALQEELQRTQMKLDSTDEKLKKLRNSIGAMVKEDVLTTENMENLRMSKGEVLMIEPEVRELRQQKVELMKQLFEYQEMNTKLKKDIQAIHAKKLVMKKIGILDESKLGSPGHGSSSSYPEVTAVDISAQTLEKLRKAEERVRMVKGQLQASEESRMALQSKYDGLQNSFNLAMSALRHCEDELLASKSEVTRLQQGTSMSHLNEVLGENRQLKENTMKLRGEILVL